MSVTRNTSLQMLTSFYMPRRNPAIAHCSLMNPEKPLVDITNICFGLLHERDIMDILVISLRNVLYYLIGLFVTNVAIFSYFVFLPLMQKHYPTIGLMIICLMVLISIVLNLYIVNDLASLINTYLRKQVLKG